LHLVTSLSVQFDVSDHVHTNRNKATVSVWLDEIQILYNDVPQHPTPSQLCVTLYKEQLLQFLSFKINIFQVFINSYLSRVYNILRTTVYSNLTTYLSQNIECLYPP
jgi:hypothetical protein